MVNLYKIKEIIKFKLRGEVPTSILIKNGLKVGKNFQRLHKCVIDYSHCWLIKIGDNVTFEPHVHVLAHDASTKNYLGYTKIGTVEIGNNVFIGARSIILPNIRIGNNCIIGAGSVVSKDIPPNSIAVGNPAKVIGNTSDYIRKNKEFMDKRPVYSKEWTLSNNISEKRKKIMIDSLRDGIGYVE